MIKKTLIGLVILLILLVLGIQLFLQYGLTASLKKYVLPAAKEKFQVDMAVDRLGVNLLGGSFAARGVRVSDPPGFVDPEILSLRKLSVKIGIPALLRGGGTEIQKAVVKDAVLTIVRNQAGALNIEPFLAASTSPAATAVAPSASLEPPTQATTTTAVPEIMIKLMDLKTLVNFIDYRLTAEPFRLGLDLHARLRNIANYGDGNQLSGHIDLQGILMINSQQCAFDLHGQIAPLIDPQHPSFNLSGSIQEVDLMAFKDLLQPHGIASGSVYGTAELRCQHGVFDPNKSILRLTLKQLQLTEQKMEQLPPMQLPTAVNIIVPIKGTLDQPEIDFSGMLEQTLLSPDVN